MMDAAIEKGAKLILGAVDGIDITEGKVTGVRVKGVRQNKFNNSECVCTVYTS